MPRKEVYCENYRSKQLSMVHDWPLAMKSRKRKANLLATIVCVTVTATIASAGIITDISVSGSIIADCGIGGTGGMPETASQTGVSSISISVCGPDEGGVSTLSATTTTATVDAYAFLGGVVSVNAANELNISLPANTFGYVELVFTGNGFFACCSAFPNQSTVVFSGDDGLVGTFPIFAPYQNETNSISGVIQSGEFLTGSFPAGYTIGSSWQINEEGTEAFGAEWDYTYAATFVPVAVPEPGSGCLAFFGLVALVTIPVVRRQTAC